jgi:hypothetical protein
MKSFGFLDIFRCPSGFTGRALNSPPPFTPYRERASGKALSLTTPITIDHDELFELPLVQGRRVA